MRQVVAMLSQLLDRINVIGVEGLHEIAKVEQARLELIPVTGPDVLIIGLEGHSFPKRRVRVERLDRAHDHRFDKFVRQEDETRVSQASRENVWR